METRQRGRKKRILEDRGGEKMPHMRSGRCIEHIMSHMRVKIGIGEVLDERGKGEVVKWMKEVKRLRGT